MCVYVLKLSREKKILPYHSGDDVHFLLLLLLLVASYVDEIHIGLRKSFHNNDAQ